MQGGRVVAMPGSAAVVPDGEIRRIDSRDLSALKAAHEAPLLGYVERLTGDYQQAEDIVQETFVRAWRAAPALASRDGSLRPWLYRVARNLATDLHRAHRARPRQATLDGAPEMPGLDQAERALQVHLIVDGLRALRSEHRVTIVEVYFRGRSIAETAALLDVPAGTVKSRCYYGLRALRRELAPSS